MATFLYIVSVVLFISFVTKQFYRIIQTRCLSKVCLVGRTAIVTGGSSGIGYQIVLGLASRGCRIIIADENVDEKVRETIFKETHNANIILKYIDLASFKSVRTFAEELLKTEEKVDILVNNAGVGSGRSAMTEDELNFTMQVNYYSAFLLTHLILGLLKKSDFGGRIIFTTSLAAWTHTLTTNAVQTHGVTSSSDWTSYANSKFCQIGASEIFAEKLKDHGVTSNCFHPHVAKTNIFSGGMKRANWYKYLGMLIAMFIINIIGKSAEDAAQTGIFLACANEMRGVTGGFYGETKPTWKPLRTTDSQLLKALWEHSELKVELRPEEKIK